MRNKMVCSSRSVPILVAKMFDDGGLINADDTVAFSQAADSLAAECDATSSTIGEHCRRHVEPELRRYVFEPHLTHPWVSRRWTNNATKSMSHLLKLSIDWNPQPLLAVQGRQPTDDRSATRHGNYNCCIIRLR